MREELLPDATRDALCAYGLGTHHSVDMLFFDMIGARREGVEFLDFQRWIRNFLNATEPPAGPVALELGRRVAVPVVTGSGEGESAVPKSIRDRVRGDLKARSDKAKPVRESREEWFGNPRLANFEHWLHDVYTDPLEALGPVRGSPVNEDKHWHKLQEPIFTTTLEHAAVNPIPSQKLLEKHALDRVHKAPGDDSAWGTPWKPESAGVEGGSSRGEHAAGERWLREEEHQSGLVYRFVERATSPPRGSQLRESRHEFGHTHWYGNDDRKDPVEAASSRAERLFGAAEEAETHSWDYLESEAERIQQHVEKHPTERHQRHHTLEEKEKELRALAKQLGLDHDKVGRNASILTGALGPGKPLEDNRRKLIDQAKALDALDR